MVRSGRLTAADLGLGTLTHILPSSTRRVFAVLTGTTGSGGTSLAFTQGETLMSAVKGAWVTILEDTSVGTGSYNWHLATIDGGTIAINPGLGVNRKRRVVALIIGTPDELSIV